MAKFATNASGVMLLLNLIQVTESISGSVVPLAVFLQDFDTVLLLNFLQDFGRALMLNFDVSPRIIHFQGM